MGFSLHIGKYVFYGCEIVNETIMSTTTCTDGTLDYAYINFKIKSVIGVDNTKGDYKLIYEG
jgi:hypothetical protein